MRKNDNQNLKLAGLKVTMPRLKILKILENANGKHVSAEVIFRRLADAGEDVGLATVYRVLTQFEAAGLVIRHHFESSNSVFELNEGAHHDHLVCIKCGLVLEFKCDDIEIRQAQIAEQSGFKMTDHSLNIYGICTACQAR